MTTLNQQDISDLLEKLRRAHRVSCSDPTDPNRHTMYGDAAIAIEQLASELGSFTATYGVVLDTTGSTDVYPTEQEAREHWAPGCRIIRIETRDTDITDQVTP
jgi:hypothetical protein